MINEKLTTSTGHNSSSAFPSLSLENRNAIINLHRATPLMDETSSPWKIQFPVQDAARLAIRLGDLTREGEKEREREWGRGWSRFLFHGGKGEGWLQRFVVINARLRVLRAYKLRVTTRLRDSQGTLYRV